MKLRLNKFDNEQDGQKGHLMKMTSDTSETNGYQTKYGVYINIFNFLYCVYIYIYPYCYDNITYSKIQWTYHMLRDPNECDILIIREYTILLILLTKATRF